MRLAGRIRREISVGSSAGIPERIAEELLGGIVGETSRGIPVKIPGRIFQRIPAGIPRRKSKIIPVEFSKDISVERILGAISEVIQAGVPAWVHSGFSKAMSAEIPKESHREHLKEFLEESRQ